MQRHHRFLPVVFAAASMLTGCLQTFGGPYGGPEPGPTPDPAGTMTPTNGDRGGGNPDPGTGASPDLGSAPTFDLAGPPAPTGSISLMVGSSSSSLRLNDTTDITVNVMPAGGFDGNVIYSLEGAPTGVTATFNPPGGMVSQPTTTVMTLKTASDAMPGTGTALTIKATSGTISGSTPVTLDIKAELLVTIAKGVNIGTSAAPNLTAFGAQTMPTIFVAPGTKVTWVNEDSINHEIHSDGTLGIQHEGGPLMANGANQYTQTFNGTGTYNYRCHIHPNMKGQIVVK
jgi:plastocyanin